MDFVVLSSSAGTTFQAVIDRVADGSLTAQCLGLVTDRDDRGCVKRAQRAGLPVRVVERVEGETREEYDHRLHTAILSLLSFHSFSSFPSFYIACIGWMWLLSRWFVQQWNNRILNVHPSLLPKHPGHSPHEEVLAAQEKESGMTIHWIDEGIDTGPIIVQKSCSVFPGDTEQTLKARVQELEKEWYPKVLQMLDEKHLTLGTNTAVSP